MYVEYKRNDKAIKAFGNHLKKIRKELGVSKNSFTQSNSMENIKQKVGERIKYLRNKENVSQEELAYRTELELSQIGRIERGVINTSISNVFLIAEVLNIPPKVLFDFDYTK